MTHEELIKRAEAFEKQAIDFFGEPAEKEQIASKSVMELKYRSMALIAALQTAARKIVSAKSLSIWKRYLINRKLSAIESDIRDILNNLKD
jgi:hypothetical protein